MKSIVLCFAFVAIVSLAMIRVEGSSMPMCPAECETCPTLDCNCGTYKDVCGCCDICRVCPDEECHPIRSDLCAEGYSCAQPAGLDSVQQMNSPGTCRRTETTSE